MHLFAKHYPNGEFGQALPDQLTWTHHIILIQKLDNEKNHVKQWYAEKTLENGWGYRKLQAQIKSDLNGIRTRIRTVWNKISYSRE